MKRERLGEEERGAQHYLIGRITLSEGAGLGRSDDDDGDDDDDDDDENAWAAVLCESRQELSPGYRAGGRGAGRRRGVPQRKAVSETRARTHAPGVWSEDRDCPGLNSLLQIEAAVFQVEQSRGAASPMITLSNSTERMCSRAQPQAQSVHFLLRESENGALLTGKKTFSLLFLKGFLY